MTPFDSDHPVSAYGDGRTMPLPQGWQPVEPQMFDTALSQTEHAFTAGGDTTDPAVQHLLAYYNPQGGYAGATFLGVPTEDHYAVTASDLWAVSTLQMTIPANTGRALLDPNPLRVRVFNYLHRLPLTLSLADAEPSHLHDMLAIYDDIRRMVPPLGKRDTNQWVFASKLCARKRPMLFPVRDSQVCTYLADNRRMGSNPGRLGTFTRDIQVIAHLVTHPQVVQRLSEVRARLEAEQPSWSFDWSDLRMLDVVLWMEATEG